MTSEDQPKKKPDWRKIKTAYQRGDGSCRELAIKFGISEGTVESRCTREKWYVEKKEIAEKVKEKVVDAMALNAIAWVNQSIERAKRARQIIDTAVGSFAPDEETGQPVIDMLNINTMLSAENKADDMGRRAFGLPDSPQKHEVNGNLIIEIIDPYAKKPDA